MPTQVLELEALCTSLRQELKGTLTDVNLLNLDCSLKLAWFGKVTLKAEFVKMAIIDVRIDIRDLEIRV